jgi:DNA-directed RNA polymerase subunit alpha
METNGSVNAEEAIKRAATILQDQLSSFVELELVEEEEALPTGIYRCNHFIFVEY